MSFDIIKVELNNTEFKSHQGHCWKILIPSGIKGKMDICLNMKMHNIICHYPENIVEFANDHKKYIYLYEDDNGIKNSCDSIKDIIELGEGRFMIEGDTFYFSSSDNTSPIDNRRKYHIVIFPKDGIDDQNFTFGSNWYDYVLNRMNENIVVEAGKHIDDWLNQSNYLKGKTIVDIGCGSGLSSLCFMEREVDSLLSFDVDPNSVLATKKLAELFNFKNTNNWNIELGSILDQSYIDSLGQFDIVYSWGVLHHTGRMWDAIENAIKLTKDDGLMFIALYSGVDNYDNELCMKQTYNKSNALGKINYIADYIMLVRKWRYESGNDPHTWNTLQSSRGMTTYNDIVDWLGGLPYEVTNTTTIVEFCKKFGMTLVRCNDPPAKACHEWLFKKHKV